MMAASRSARCARCAKPELVVYVENAGDFEIPLSAVKDAEAEKVILDSAVWSPSSGRPSAAPIPAKTRAFHKIKGTIGGQ